MDKEVGKDGLTKMPRLLVDSPSGIQELFKVDETGSYYDLTRVVWDERLDGPLPTPIEQVGGLIRDGNTLTFSAQMKAADDAQKEILNAPIRTMEERVERLRNVDFGLIPEEFRAIIKDIINQIV